MISTRSCSSILVMKLISANCLCVELAKLIYILLLDLDTESSARPDVNKARHVPLLKEVDVALI